MRRFAGEFEVLFVESLPMRSVAAVDRHELQRVWRKLRAGIRIHTVAPHLHVLRPPPIPPAGRLGQFAQLAAVRAQIVYAERRLGPQQHAISWFSVPIAAPLRGRLGERGAVFYYQDRYDQFSHVDAPRLRRLIGELAVGCDASIATSEELAADLCRLGAHPVVIPHGVDLSRFEDGRPAPRDLTELERPLVGYVGLLDDYLSFDAIRAVANRLERGTVVLVGTANCDVSRLSHPRIRLLGQRPYDSIPAYLSAFACCILPFAVNALTRAVDPIKLREYLAAGRPVVSTPLPAVTGYRDVVELAADPEAFAEAVTRLVGPSFDTPDLRARRRRRVAPESWDRVAEQIRPILVDLAARPPKPRTAAHR